MKNNFETAVFGGGCFWCLEAGFSMLKGVRAVTSGYAGGHSTNPTYEQVSTGNTAHAEVVRVEFDPEKITYEDLLAIFFSLHDPTTPNRQGVDVGTQYRSIILFANDSQREQAEKFAKKLEREKIFDHPVVTEIKALERFWSAEDYHQKYFEKNPGNAYCQINTLPKLDKLREKFEKFLK